MTTAAGTTMPRSINFTIQKGVGAEAYSVRLVGSNQATKRRPQVQTPTPGTSPRAAACTLWHSSAAAGCRPYAVAGGYSDPAGHARRRNRFGASSVSWASAKGRLGQGRLFDFRSDHGSEPDRQGDDQPDQSGDSEAVSYTHLTLPTTPYV